MRFLFNCGRLVNALIVLELLARSVVSYKFSSIVFGGSHAEQV